MSGSASSPAKSGLPPTRYRSAQPSSSNGALSSPGRCGGRATDPGATGSPPPPTPRPPARPSPARSPARRCIGPSCSATAPPGSSTRSGWPPGRSYSGCCRRAVPTSYSARSARPRPSTPRVGSGPDQAQRRRYRRLPGPRSSHKSPVLVVRLRGGLTLARRVLTLGPHPASVLVPIHDRDRTEARSHRPRRSPEAGP
jgi:hypothetical protein